MKTLKFIVLIPLLILIGCETVPTVKTEYVVIAPQDSFLADCATSAPPDKERYMAATPEQREEMLYKLSLEQYKNTATCNARLKKTREWKVEQLKNYANKKPD